MRAQCATGTPSSPSSPSPIAPAHENAVRVRIAGSDRTYELRNALRGMGLRWVPLSHAWHGSLPPTARREIERDLGLPVQLVRALDSFSSAGVHDPPESTRAPAPEWTPSRRVRDGSRSRLESRLALPGGEDDDSPEAPLGRFTLADVTSGLPDDSREADQRAASRHLADVWGRVKSARAAIARLPGAAAVFLSNPARATWLCSRFGITPGQLHGGVRAVGATLPNGSDGAPSGSGDRLKEGRARERATFDAVRRAYKARHTNR